MSQNEFARGQLKKHGWTEGQGLGREKSGRTEAIKVHLKNNKTGIGHDPGKEFTKHWWDDIFNKTASSIKVETTEDGEVKVGRKNDQKLKSRTKPKSETLYGNFVKGATLTQEDGHHVERAEAHVDSGSEEEEPSSRPSEEELFQHCGGRTAHKGARHGLGLSGKLQRIQHMEQQMLQQIHSQTITKLGKRKSDQKEQSMSENDQDLPSLKKKKKKKEKKKKRKDES